MAQVSVRLPELLVGPSDPRPTLEFRLQQMADGVAVMAKHSEDIAEQMLLELRYQSTTGVLEVHTRDIHAPKLAEVCHVELKQGIGTRFVDRSASV